MMILKLGKPFLFAALMLSMTACKIDKAYDLDQPVDAEMVIVRELTVPIGDVGGIDTKTLIVLLGKEYISYDEQGNVVLDFTENPELLIQFDIKGLNIRSRYNPIRPILFSLELGVENTSPFSFEIEAVLIDSTGEAVKVYDPVIDGTVTGGHAGAPSYSSLSLRCMTSAIEPFDGIRFRFHFHGGDLAGKKYVVKSDETLSFRNLKFHIPDGIPMEPQWIKMIKPYLSLVTLLFDKDKDEKEAGK